MSSTQNHNTIDNWNNSYFTTELYNNSFMYKTKDNINQIKNNNETKDDHSKILSIIINGLIIELSIIIEFKVKFIKNTNSISKLMII